MALFAYCTVEYQTIIVNALGDSSSLDIQDIDFVTGDLGSPTTFNNNGLAITGAQGTTNTNARVATDTTIDVVSVAGMTVGDHIAIELDVPAAYGTHFWTRIESIATLTITLSEALPGAVSIGNQVVTANQLDTTTGFSVFEDFKKEKADAIRNESNILRTGFIAYNNEEFNPSLEKLGDMASYLASGKDPSKYTIETVEGNDYTFADSDDLFTLTDLLSESYSIILVGQGTLIDSVSLAINSQAAMDAIVDSRTVPVPTGSGTLQPFVQYDLSTRDTFGITASSATAVEEISFRDESSIDQGTLRYSHSTDVFLIQHKNATGSLDLQSLLSGLNISATGNLICDSTSGNAEYKATGGGVTIFADDSITITADNASTTINATGGTFAINAASNTVDINCGLFDLDCNGAVTLTTSAGNVTLEPDGNAVMQCDSGYLDVNAGFSTGGGAGRFASFFSDGIASATSEWYLSNASPEGVITGNGGDIAIVDNGTSSDILFKTTDASNTGWETLQNTAAIMVFGASGVASTTTTRYLFPSYDDSTALTAVIQMTAPRSGTLRNLHIRHNTGAGNGNNIVYTVRVAGVGSSLAVTIASTATTGSDTSNTATVTAGDAIDIEVTKAAVIAASPSEVFATMEFI